MPRTYFEPESLSELGQVFAQTKTILESRGLGTLEQLDFVASLIFSLAAAGSKPDFILAEVVRSLPAPYEATILEFPPKTAQGAQQTLEAAPASTSGPAYPTGPAAR
jgi:hypothetical protein